ncbi:MAG TPA: nucleotidyltransferase family protein [Lacibacter sp.]|nr:nucleotidyltransferase family protein [Lacibacter sp.]HMO88091.1 nucleotidyltransferase family protein [Lacibacter sp.]HMP86814.1 nucleotidyltransferase family protein [Lacibacter sp.]
MSQDVMEQLRSKKNELLKKYPIQSLAVFGSYSRGDQTTESDVDILVDFSKPVGIEFLLLAHELEDLLGKKVDLVTRKAIKQDYFTLIAKDLRYV